MAKRYVFVRMPEEIYDKYKLIQVRLRDDISRIAGRPVPITMPRVFNAIVSNNENFIQIDLKNMLKNLRGKGRW